MALCIFVYIFYAGINCGTKTTEILIIETFEELSYRCHRLYWLSMITNEVVIFLILVLNKIIKKHLCLVCF